VQMAVPGILNPHEIGEDMQDWNMFSACLPPYRRRSKTEWHKIPSLAIAGIAEKRTERRS
jgi:hypothetical protein